MYYLDHKNNNKMLSLREQIKYFSWFKLRFPYMAVTSNW